MSKVDYKNELIKFINEATKEDLMSIYDFALESLNIANEIHLYHWSCNTNTQHVHFQNFYEAIRDFADEAVEIALASGEKFNVKSQTIKYDYEGFNLPKATAKIKGYITKLKVFAKKFEDDIGLNTLMTDTIQKLEKEFGLLINFE